MQAAHRERPTPPRGGVTLPAPPPRIGIVAALAAEARAFRAGRLRGDGATPGSGARELADGSLLAVSGMGAAAAAASALELIAAGAGALASWGFAGGLDPALAPGMLFLPEEVIDPAGRLLPSRSGWRERLGQALAGERVCTHGRLLTSERIVASIEEKCACRRASGAAAVDLESFAIAAVAERHQLPFLCVRVIVDGAHDALPQALLRVTRADGGLHALGLAGELVRAPREVGGALLRLARRYGAAQHTLRHAARRGLLASCLA